MRRWLTALPLALIATACEDADNPGNDNLLTGASVVVVIVIIAIVWFVMRRD